jgi:membrane-bound serine protease (ClpP class)
MVGGWLVAGLGESSASSPSPGSRHVLVTRVATEITPVVADHLDEGMARAEQEGAAAYLVELDTPGGLAESMREIVQNILASNVPVIVYVAPEGARAASAGAVITLASHVALMAPATSIGAATPVGLQGEDLSDKIVNDAAAQTESLARLRGRDVAFAGAMVRQGQSLAVDQAVDRNVVDGQASSLVEALQVAHGRTVQVAGTQVTLNTADVTTERQHFGWIRQVQQFLANPNLAFLLFTIGALGLIYELASPGVGVAGAVGAVSLVLALFGVAVLPVTAAGLLLLAVATGLLVAELFAPGIGGFAIGGGVVLVLAAMFLFDETQGVSVDLEIALPIALVMIALAVLAGRVALRSQRGRTRASGKGLLIGTQVTVHEVYPAPGGGSRGRAFTDGTWWQVHSDDELSDGQRVQVNDMTGVTLVVRPLDQPPIPQHEE